MFSQKHYNLQDIRKYLKLLKGKQRQTKILYPLKIISEIKASHLGGSVGRAPTLDLG